MSDDVNVVEQQEQDVVEQIDYKSKYEEAQKAIEALAAKKDELLKETKHAKAERLKIAAEAQAEQLKTAEKNGEYEKLWKQTQEEKEQIRQELQQERQSRRDERISLVATRLAVELAKGDPDKAELLTTFVAQSMGKIADEYGNIDAELLSSVKKQFETEKRFAPLLGGNQAVGGGAPGNTRSASNADKILDRAGFDSLSSMKKMEFVKSGGILKDSI